MDKFIEIRKKLRKTEELKKEQLLELRNFVRKKIIKCPECGKESRLSSWTFIQKKYYVRCRGGGGRWRNRQTILCDIGCPKCGKEAFLFGHPQKNTIVFWIDESLCGKKDLFKEVLYLPRS